MSGRVRDHAVLQKRAVGREHDYEFAEGFRCARYDGIERLARGQELPEDV